MSQAITLARPYARAAFEVARAAGDTGTWSHALALAAMVANDARVSDLAGDPRVQPAQLVALHLPRRQRPHALTHVSKIIGCR